MPCFKGGKRWRRFSGTGCFMRCRCKKCDQHWVNPQMVSLGIERAGEENVLVASPVKLYLNVLNDEQDQNSNQEGKDAERFCERHTDEEVTGLLRCS